MNVLFPPQLECLEPHQRALAVAGNTLEWCFDDTRHYGVADSEDPIGDVTGEHRAIRGGSFVRSENECRAGYRDRRGIRKRWGSTSFRAAFEGAFPPAGDLQV